MTGAPPSLPPHLLLLAPAPPPFSPLTTTSSPLQVAGKFIQAGTQIAAGVPFMIGEPADTKTFRIGLFGLDKLKDTDKTVKTLRDSLEKAVPDDVTAHLSGYIKKAKWTVPN